MTEQQTWTVLEWGVIDAGVLGALIVCVSCEGAADGCEMCNDDGRLFQPYYLPNGVALDLDRYAEILIQIEPSNDAPDP